MHVTIPQVDEVAHYDGTIMNDLYVIVCFFEDECAPEQLVSIIMDASMSTTCHYVVLFNSL